MKIKELKKIRAGISMDEVKKNNDRKINADRPSDKFGNSRDIYQCEEAMRNNPSVKWFGGEIACTGCVPFAGFLLKSFGDDRIVNFLKKAPEDSNAIILFAHVDEERGEVNAVCSNLVVNYHAWDDNGTPYPEYVHFKFTHVYRCEIEEWYEDPEAVLKKVREKGLLRR